MKIQDIGFVTLFALMIIFRKHRFFAHAGLVCLLVAMPLFARWVFFTAERLTWYATAFFLAQILVEMASLRNKGGIA